MSMPELPILRHKKPVWPEHTGGDRQGFLALMAWGWCS